MTPYRGRIFWKYLFIIAIFASLGQACKSDSDTTSEDEENISSTPPPKVPAFNRDNAYDFVKQQLEFGPRAPGTEGHAACRDWLAEKLEEYGAEVTKQNFTARIYTGKTFPSTNIIGAFNPGNPRRIVLAAHYDTRLWAEEDADPERKDQPIPGADDGASGVGVLLEVARQLQETPIDLGVDFIFFDAEDQGERDSDDPTTWCLGAQYWANQPHKAGYKAQFGILLDMVGSKNATFQRENVAGYFRHSTQVTELYNKVWNMAQGMGKGRFFSDNITQIIVDDHFFINQKGQIPFIDIINKPLNSETGFGSHWHTHEDDLTIIDKSTLGSVGQVVLAVVYRTNAGQF